jgi:hypothetical protein
MFEQSTYIGRLVSVRAEAEHRVTGRLDNDGVPARFDRLGGDDVLDPTVLLLPRHSIFERVWAARDA